MFCLHDYVQLNGWKATGEAQWQCTICKKRKQLHNSFNSFLIHTIHMTLLITGFVCIVEVLL